MNICQVPNLEFIWDGPLFLIENATTQCESALLCARGIVMEEH